MYSKKIINVKHKTYEDLSASKLQKRLTYLQKSKTNSGDENMKAKILGKIQRNMKSKLARVFSLPTLIATALVITVATPITFVGVQSANAVNTLPSARLMTASPGLISVITHDDDASGWAQYYNEGLHYKDAFAYSNDAITMHWIVSNADGTPMANQTVNLIVNKGYSVSTATWKIGASGVVVNPISGSVNGGSFAGTTDANGHAMFTVVDASSIFEPSNTDTKTKSTVASKAFGQFTLQIGNRPTERNAAGQDLDIVDVHLIGKPGQKLPPATPGVIPAVAILRLDDADVDSMTDRSSDWNPSQFPGNPAGSRSLVKFLTAGDTLTLHYTVTNGLGQPVPGLLVTLKEQPQGNAIWQPCSASNLPTATTDANGRVTFEIKNTNTDAEAEAYPVAPSSMTHFDPSHEASYLVECDFAPTLHPTGPAWPSSEIVDLLWTHVVASPSYVPSLKVAKIRLIEDTPTVTLKNWYRVTPSARDYVKFITTGGTFTLKYQVTNESNTPLVGETVQLGIQKNGGHSENGVEQSVKFQGITNYGDITLKRSEGTPALTAVSDANGFVSFTLVNTNKDADGEAYPTAPSTINHWDDATRLARIGGDGGRVYVNITPKVARAQLSIWDRIQADLVNSSGASANPTPTPTPTPTPSGVAKPSIRITSPTYTASNSVITGSEIAQYFTPGVKLITTYLKTGTTQSVTYHVNKAAGVSAGAHQRVDIEANAAYSNSKASWVVSGSGTPLSGSAPQTNIIIAAQSGDSAGGTVTGYTDEYGNVTFTYRNTDTTGEPAPNALNMAVPIGSARKYGQFKPLYFDETGTQQAANAVDVDFVTYDIYTGTIASGTPAVVNPPASSGGAGGGSPAPAATPSTFQTNDLVFNGSNVTLPSTAALAATLSAAAKSANATVAYAVDAANNAANCSVSGTILTFAKAGTCTVAATLSATGYTELKATAVFTAVASPVATPVTTPVVVTPAPVNTPVVTTTPTPAVVVKPSTVALSVAAPSALVAKSVVAIQTANTSSAAVPNAATIKSIQAKVKSAPSVALVYPYVKSAADLNAAAKAIAKGVNNAKISIVSLKKATTPQCAIAKAACYGIVIKKS